VRNKGKTESEPGESGRGGNRAWTLALIGALAGAVGAAGGIAGTVLSWKSEHDVNHTKVHVVAAVSASDYTQQGFGVRVALVNQGLGGTTVTKAQLVVDGQAIAEARGWVRDPRIFSASLPYRANVKPALLDDVTVAVGARSARSVGFVFDLNSCPAASSDAPAKGAAALACAVARCDSARCNDGHHFAIRLTMEPGKEKETPLDVRPQLRRFAGWKPSVARSSGAVTALKIHRIGTNDPTQSEVVALELWPVGSGAPPRVLSRPVVGRATALYPIGDLPRGRYVWAFLTHARPLVSGYVNIPCRGCDKPLSAVRGQVGPRETKSGLPASAPPPPAPPKAPKRAPVVTPGTSNGAAPAGTSEPPT
jgi:hypothetical protein